MKKIVALMLALVLVTVSFASLAAGSKTTKDVGKKTTVTTPQDQGEGLVIKIVDPSEEEIAFFKQMTTGDPEVMPEGAKPEELTELLALLVSGAKEGIGDHIANLEPTTVFEVGQDVHAYMGILKDQKVTWQELIPVNVVEDGTLDLPFSEKQLLTMQAAKDVVLAIFVGTGVQ